MTMLIDEAQENKKLVNRYRKLIRLVTPKISPDDKTGLKEIKKAFKFAVDAHKDVRRKSGEPYIFHPVAVATIVVEEMGLGKTAVISALLHDVVEDTDYEIEDIKAHFGPEIALIIEGLTKITSVANGSKEQLQTQNFKKVLFTIAKDIRVIFIKLADRLHNMRTLGSMSKDKKFKIKSETEFIYAPLAHRLGFYNIKSELEDLSLMHSDLEAYNQIKQKIADTEEVRRRFTKSFIRPIEKKLKSQDLKYTVKSRVKAISSIYQKMKRQQVNFEEVYDLFAVRFIIDVPYEKEKTACWAVYSELTEYYTPNPSRLRDWLSQAKNNGYESLHTTVMGPDGKWVEVQIRSKRMDEIAEKGFAAHHLYKDSYGVKKSKVRKRDLDRGFNQWLSNVRESIEKNELSGMEFLVDFKESNLYGKEVFVFTPKGDIKYLPEGASVLDFAFTIHTEVGVCCIGAKINNKIASLEYKLNNGDQVEILTTKNPKINEGWLRMVTTSKARSGIKEYLKRDKKKYSDLGKETVKRKMTQLKLPFSQANLNKLMQYFNIQDELDLYFKVGTGVINHTLIKNFNEPGATEKLELAIAPDKDVRDVKRQIKEQNETEVFVIGNNIKGIDYSISKCCQPIPGEDITGFVTIGKGISIHSATCPNAVALSASYGYRIVQVRWADTHVKDFLVKLNIEGTDRQSLIQDVTKVVSDSLKLNIHSLNIKAEGTIFMGTLEIEVSELNQLKILIQRLKSLDGIVRVVRV